MEESNVDTLHKLFLKLIKEKILQNSSFLSLLYKDFTEVLLLRQLNLLICVLLKRNAKYYANLRTTHISKVLNFFF